MQLCFCLPADAKVLDVIPRSATASYAAPEVLRSLQLQCEGASAYRMGINGPSADFWAVGVVLYELLTGELPFIGKGHLATEAPECVPPHLKPEWERYSCMLQGQWTWVRPSSAHVLFLCLTCCSCLCTVRQTMYTWLNTIHGFSLPQTSTDTTARLLC